MIAKRIAALAAAVALILGAMLIRDLADGDDGGGDRADDPVDAAEIVCAAELAEVCRTVDAAGFAVRVEEAGDTLDALASAGVDDPVPIWLTFAPFPGAVDLAREQAGRRPTAYGADVLASSPVVLVTTPDTAGSLSCGDPAGWRCLADAELSVGFASTPESGIGLVAATAAGAGYSDGPGAPFADPIFQVWLRDLLTSVNPSQLTSGTAVATIQVRRSAMDGAAGILAELDGYARDDLAVLYAEPMGRADVILAVPDGASVPDGLAASLTDALLDLGWQAPASVAGAAPDAGALLATRDFWRNL